MGSSAETGAAEVDGDCVQQPTVTDRLLAKNSAKVNNSSVRYGTSVAGGGKGAAIGTGAGVKHKREEEDKTGTVLLVSFLLMLIVGTGNRIFMKLMTLPMYNYPFFLNMLTTFVYIPACFLYIIPMILFGSAITPEQRAIPQMKFAVMGLLDSIAGIMGIFAVNYIVNAGMIVLLQQAGIPISMIISRLLLGARYSASQYAGATVVIAGIIVTLIPLFVGSSEGSSDVSSSSQTVWSIVQVLSCIPMCLSSVYKEKALGEADIDVIYLNGWVSVYQFAAAIVFAIPSAFAMGVPIQDLPQNLWEGFLCFTGTTTINMSMAEELATVPVMGECDLAPFFVTSYLVFNMAFNIILIVILKHGSANILWLASTVMVPIGNVAFSMDFMPGHQPMRTTDVWGLFFIMLGLLLYRFSSSLLRLLKRIHSGPSLEEDEAGRKVRLVERGVTRAGVKYIGVNQAEFLEPIIETRVWKAQRARLARSPEQVRGSFLLRLGIPPSPQIQFAPGGGSPALKRDRVKVLGKPKPRPSSPHQTVASSSSTLKPLRDSPAFGRAKHKSLPLSRDV